MTAITFSWMDCHIDWCLIYSALALQVWLGLSAAVDFERGARTFTYSDGHSPLRYVLMEFCIHLLHSEDAKWTIYQSQAMQASVLHHRLCWILLWKTACIHSQGALWCTCCKLWGDRYTAAQAEEFDEGHGASCAWHTMSKMPQSTHSRRP